MAATWMWEGVWCPKTDTVGGTDENSQSSDQSLALSQPVPLAAPVPDTGPSAPCSSPPTRVSQTAPGDISYTAR